MRRRSRRVPTPSDSSRRGADRRARSAAPHGRRPRRCRRRRHRAGAVAAPRLAPASRCSAAATPRRLTRAADDRRSGAPVARLAAGVAALRVGRAAPAVARRPPHGIPVLRRRRARPRPADRTVEGGRRSPWRRSFGSSTTTCRWSRRSRPTGRTCWARSPSSDTTSPSSRRCSSASGDRRLRPSWSRSSRSTPSSPTRRARRTSLTGTVRRLVQRLRRDAMRAPRCEADRRTAPCSHSTRHPRWRPVSPPTSTARAPDRSCSTASPRWPSTSSARTRCCRSPRTPRSPRPDRVGSGRADGSGSSTSTSAGCRGRGCSCPSRP